MRPEAVQRLPRTVPANSVPWFDRLNELGLFERWLSSQSVEDVRYAAWLIGAPAVWEERSRRIAELETSNAELMAALIVAGSELRKLNFGRQDSPVLKLLRRTLRDARQAARASAC